MAARTWSLGTAVFLAALFGSIIGNVLSGSNAILAETGASSDDVVVVTGSYKAGQHDLVWVIDTKIDRLLVYEFQGNTLNLAAARRIEWDLKLHEWPADSQTPSVSKVEKDTRSRPNPPMGRRKLVAVTGNTVGGNPDQLFVYDTSTQRLVIYRYNNNSLDLVAARITTFDLKLDEYLQDKQTPSVPEVKRMIEGAEKEEVARKKRR